MADSKSQNRHQYVPPHVQQQMAKQLQQNVPKHMQQYVGAFMEQNVVHPNKYGNPLAGMSTTGNNPTGRPTTYKPVTHLPRDSHYQQYRDPNTPPTDLYPAQPEPAAGTGQPDDQQQYGHYPQQPSPQPQQPYDFIMNPEQPKPGRGLPGLNSSLPVRIGIFAGGLLVLLIIFTVVRNLLAGPSVMPYFVSVAQQQQELIHLASNVTNAGQTQNISTGNQNFAATAQLSLSTSQAELVKYITTNGQKLENKQLGLKIDPKLDERLQTAAAAGTYNQTFKEIMQSEMNDYINSLKSAFQKTSGKNGRALLNNDYEQAQLLMNQLNTDAAIQ